MLHCDTGIERVKLNDYKFILICWATVWHIRSIDLQKKRNEADSYILRFGGYLYDDG